MSRARLLFLMATVATAFLGASPARDPYPEQQVDRQGALAVTSGFSPAGSPSPATGPAIGPAAERVEFSGVRDPEALRVTLERLGGHVEVVSHDRVQALVPGGLARATALLPGLGPGAAIAPPLAPVVMQALDVGEAGRQIGADRWHAAGFSGHGTSIAVVDTGFVGYEGLIGTALPTATHARSFRADGSMRAGTDHGTRAAEIVHRIAPGAELYLLTFSTLTELSAVVDFLIAEGIETVSFSIGFIHNGPGNGTGPVDAVVSRAVDAGVLWVSAAGNWALQHWSGGFTDRDRDGVHEFASGVQNNGRDYVAGDLIIVSLRWDAPWGAACSDYDIELFGPSGELVRAARGIQGCQSDPVEGLRVLATTGGHYTVRIVQAEPAVGHRLSLLMLGAPDRSEPLDRSVAAGSLAQPADLPGVLTVGALPASGKGVAPFSSRGVVGGLLKPEILSPTSGIAATVGTMPVAFAGTSAAAPHVAAAAMLLREALWYPGTDVVRGALLGRASRSASGLATLRLGALTGLGRLLPVGAEEARFLGTRPGGPGLAVVQYRGPDGYPARFLHLLVGGQPVIAAYSTDIFSGRWSVYLRHAPDSVNSLRTLANGDLVIVNIGG